MNATFHHLCLALITVCPIARLVAANHAPATVLYVAVDGRDDWTGTQAAPSAEGTDGPFATVTRAQVALRTIRQDSPANPASPRPVIYVRGGTYELAQPLVFTPDDSHCAIRAYAGERPVFSGGRRIDGWTVDTDGWWRVTLPEVRQGRWHFTQLFVDDQRRWRPRLPQTGYFEIAEELDRSPDAKGPGIDRFGFAGNDVRADWANLDNVEALVFHSWSMSRLPIAAVDATEKVVTFHGTSPSRSSWGQFRKGNRYLIENVREALGEPGHWYLDRPSGELIYVPRPGERPDKTVVVAPRLEYLVRFAGDPAHEASVEDIQLQGLTFAHGAWPIPPTGQAISQAEINLDGALTASGARELLFEQCAVRHVGTYAIAFGDGCRDNQVISCELIDLGAGGIKIGATRLDDWGGLSALARSPEARVSHHTVRDCTIAHGGRLHPAAIGVWIGHSPYNTIEHNEIFDLYYSATSVGWVWGYSRSHAHHNRVVYNRLHTLGQGVLSDMGAVYTLGISPGTMVTHNVIHDVQAFDYGGWGLYTDEGSTGVTMAYNLVYRTKTGGFHQHYGRENRILNNILAFSRTDQLQRTRVEDHLSFTFERNIVLFDQGQLMSKQWADPGVDVDHNLYWNLNGPTRFPGDRTIETWRQETGHDQHSIVADPGCVDPRQDDFRLSPDSPAFRVGFVSFDTTKAGRLTPRFLTVGLPPVPAAFE